jgi:hypothetical protein
VKPRSIVTHYGGPDALRVVEEQCASTTSLNQPPNLASNSSPLRRSTPCNLGGVAVINHHFASR